MKIMWISPNGGNYKSNQVKGTGGWIGALQSELNKVNTVQLSIVFFDQIDDSPLHDGATSYYPIKRSSGKNPFEKLFLRHFASKKKILNRFVNRVMSIIESLKPDVIHIWGVENDYACIIPFLSDYQVVVHIQGFASACFNSYLPPSVSETDLKNIDKWYDRYIFRRGHYYYYNQFKQKAIDEIANSAFVKNWIGRTEWDYIMSQILSPQSRYFHGDELMRSDFESGKWKYHFNGVLKIHSSISDIWYKGIDMIFKISKILIKNNFLFEWHVYGVSENSSIVKHYCDFFNINLKNNNLFFHGSVSGEEIKKSLISSDVYVHPSYIENSSNAIAEAQLIGTPVIAQYVGGNKTMLKDDSGILVSPNDPYSFAYYITLMTNEKYAMKYSENAVSVSSIRNDRASVISNLLKIYSQLVSEK